MDHVPAALGAKRATIELHKIYQTLIERDTQKRRGGVVIARLRAAQRAAKSLRSAALVLGDKSREVSGRYGVSRLRRLLHSWFFSYEMQLHPGSYYKHSLFLPANWRRRKEYIFHEEICTLLPFLNAAVNPKDAADLTDKRRFSRRIARAGLPGIKILAEFEHGTAIKTPTSEEKFEGDLFSKPVDRYCGEGASLWLAQADGTYLGRGSRRVRMLELLRELESQSTSGPVLLQPRIRNHRDLLPISGKALSTARIVTARFPDRQPELALAAYRMPQADLIADNFAVGGLASPVDLTSGKLGPARCKRISFEALLTHPDTLAPIAGVVLPYWHEAVNLALLAHQEFAEMPSVGWDVAITDSGPILVEGNGVWCVDLAQITHQYPLGDTIVPDCLLSHFQRQARTTA